MLRQAGSRLPLPLPLTHASVSSLCRRLDALRPLRTGIDGVGAALLPRQGHCLQQWRGAKRTARMRLQDLPQGPLPAAGPATEDTGSDEGGLPVYPTVLQGARNNMLRFRDCVLLTRVGSFYELYFEQAEEYAQVLGLRLGYKKTAVHPVPMAGFPYFHLDRYLKMLVQDLQKKVAISEEFSNDVEARAKAGGLMFNRRVTRIVTPGTLIDENFMDPYANNYLLAMHLEEGPGTDAEGRPHGAGRSVGLAWVDLSTGQFYTQPATLATLPSLATRIGAQEVIVDPSVTASVSIQDVSNWTGVDSRLISQFGLSDQDATQMIARWAGMLEVPLSPAALSTFSSIELKACNLLLAYVQEQMQGLKVNLQPPVREPFSDTLTIDRSSIRGLELLRTARDQTSRGSLLYAVRRTRTKGGARLLQQRLTSPSASLPVINERLDLVSRLHDDESLRDTVVAHLDRTSDIQRLVQRFSLGRGDADDLLALARSITAAASVHTVLKDYVRHAPRATPASGPARDSLSSIQRLIDRAQLDGPKVLAEQIRQAIDEDGLTVQHRLEDDLASDAASLAHVVATTEGDAADLDTLPKRVRTAGAKESAAGSSVDPEAWVMRRDASPAIAKLHERLDRLRDEKEQLAAQLREHAGFASLSLKWTPRNGYIAHVRIPPSSRLSESQLDAIGARTLSASRSSRSLQIAAWTQLGARFDEIRGRVRAEETRIFEQLREQVIRNLVRLRGIAAVMDELDVACSFAAVAERHRWVRPIVTDTTVYRIVGGRHPTVELGLEEAGRTFVSNDCSLDAGGSSGAGNRGNGGADERTWLITGPNMAGKSTFLRQNALLVILAQAGSFVPAEYAEVGIVDRLFTRIGAADDLFRDQSTFMVEMLESATILRGATRRSFVVMDEVGRGTTPEDGASVAFACLNHLHNESRCRTLFATHFHAVADLTAGWDGLGRYCTDVRIHAPDAVDASGSRSHIGAGLASSFSFDHRLRRGMNRTSHALMVAQLAGLPRCVLEVAAGARQGMRGAHALPSLASGSPIQAPTTPRKVETVVAG